jgi:hypothetical protein
MRNIMISLMCIASMLSVCFLTGCNTVQYQAYTGPALAQDQVAVLVLCKNFCYEPLAAAEIDGKKMSWVTQEDNFNNSMTTHYTLSHPYDGSIFNPYPSTIELLPGLHVITFIPSNADADPVIKDLEVQAGKTYIARIVTGEWNINSEDRKQASWDVEITEE